MSRALTDQFMAALQQAEQSGDVTPLVELYADASTTNNLTDKTWEGKGGAQEFWKTYLGNFETIRSEFTQAAGDDTTGIMEWVSRGQLRGGRDIEYRGVSVIDSEGEKVKAFRTYYDSAAFVAPVKEASS